MLNWGGALITGIVFGALIASLIAGEFSIRTPQPKVIIQTFYGGFMMAFGATVASGCQIGQIVSGIPQLSLGSLLGGICIVLGGWIMAYFLFIRPMNAD